MHVSLKKGIKANLFRFFPRTASRIFSARARALSHQLVERWGCTALNRKLIAKFGAKVLHGPFTGIVLMPETHKEHIAPHLLGLYEGELYPAWKTVFEGTFTQILDVGAKFGFYAVALARQFPKVPVLAFDTDPWARKAMREMNEGNGVKVQVETFCDPAWLRTLLAENAFIFSDCEGYEATLFGGDPIPALKSATMLIEIHEQFSPGVTAMLREKFARSHDIAIINSRIDSPVALSELDALTPEERTMAICEYRDADQSWMLLEPRPLKGGGSPRG